MVSVVTLRMSVSTFVTLLLAGGTNYDYMYVLHMFGRFRFSQKLCKMAMAKRKNLNIFALGAVCLVGIFSDFGTSVDLEGRKLQVDQSVAPASGTTRVSVLLSPLSSF